jgi:hypothetical protein
MTQRIATQTTPALVGGAVEGGAEALSTQAVQRDLAALFEDPALRAALVEMTGSLVGGVVDPLTEPERAARLRAFSAAFLEVLGSTSARVLRRDLSPAMASAAANAVDQVLTAALADEHQMALGDLVHQLISASAAGMAAGLRDELYPAMGVTFGSPGFAESFGILGYEFSRGVVRGSDDAMREIAARNAANEEPPSFLARIGNTTVAGVSTSIFVAVMMAITLVVASVLLVRASRERQRMELATARRETALLALVAELSARVGVDVQGRLGELEAADIGLGPPRP